MLAVCGNLDARAMRVDDADEQVKHDSFKRQRSRYLKISISEIIGLRHNQKQYPRTPNNNFHSATAAGIIPERIVQ